MRLMRTPTRRRIVGLAAWLAISAAVCVMLSRSELAHLRDAFETDARIAHRLLSQRASQHDAVLATLALLQPDDGAAEAVQRLPSVYPQILGVQRRAPGQPWSDARIQAAEVQSKALRRPVLALYDLAAARYQMVLAAEPASYALQIDLRAVVPWSEWPMAADSSPVRVTLESGGQSLLLQPGRLGDGGWRFEFRKHLAADSQPFDVVAVRQVGWSELPWLAMAGWVSGIGAFVVALTAMLRQRAGRRRAEELLRLGQVSRLNALGELAAGMAHEVNQPLTAVLANSQAALRLLKEEPPDLDTARGAIGQAVEQSRRVTDVLGRLRRAVEQPGIAQASAVPLEQAMRNVFYLLEPELHRCQVSPELLGPAEPVTVLAEPVALEQVIYNLITNALQALGQVPAAQRQLKVELSRDAGSGVLIVSDTGPGIPDEALPRLFEPFFTTRETGLGLGLSLCETLVQGMGGQLSAGHHDPRGAQFRLSLPLAAA
jgi:signal transduction histidine kinase